MEPPAFAPIIHTDIPLGPSEEKPFAGYTFYSVQTNSKESVTEFDLKGKVGGVDREVMRISYDDIIPSTSEP